MLDLASSMRGLTQVKKYFGQNSSLLACLIGVGHWLGSVLSPMHFFLVFPNVLTTWQMAFLRLLEPRGRRGHFVLLFSHSEVIGVKVSSILRCKGGTRN